jgi:hypothetical protein
MGRWAGRTTDRSAPTQLAYGRRAYSRANRADKGATASRNVPHEEGLMERLLPRATKAVASS